jgi:HEAT repeat protein
MGSSDPLTALLGEPDEDRRWAALSSFVATEPTAAHRVAATELAAGDVRRRELAADVLGQVASVQQGHAPEIADLLMARVGEEADAGVLNSLVVALGHTADSRARSVVLRLADHPEAQVRAAVAFALPSLEPDERALVALRTLSADSHDDVRDWATFALAESDADDDATVEALAARSDDPDDDTRAEGIFGLARRRDPRARRLVEQELARPRHGALAERARELLDG